MSTATKPTKSEAALAFQFMADEVHTPAFFEKLASYGVHPTSEADARQLITLGEQLYALAEQGQLKSASANDQGNPFLQNMINKLASATAPSAEQVDAQMKQAAYDIARTDVTAKTAALLYNYVLQGGEVAEDQPAA